jgi:cytochrome d ubiquinol oxidase subunit II
MPQSDAAPVAPLLWLLLIVLSLVLYMTLDGFDLGIGLLLPFQRDPAHRRAMIELVATVWDGNESWLVLLGVALFAGFPLAYATAMPALYVPVTVMLLALLARGAAFEFSSQCGHLMRAWGHVFAAASALAVLCQGLALGAVLGGLRRAIGGGVVGPFDFLSPYSVLVALLVMALYALAGAGWMVDKARGELRAHAGTAGRIAGGLVAVLLLAALAATPVVSPIAHAAHAAGPIVLAATLLLLALLGLGVAFATLDGRHGAVPFLAAAGTLAALDLGAVAVAYPFLLPGALTLWQAAAPPNTYNLLLGGVALCVPVTLAYSAYAYYVFRGPAVVEAGAAAAPGATFVDGPGQKAHPMPTAGLSRNGATPPASTGGR